MTAKSRFVPQQNLSRCVAMNAFGYCKKVLIVTLTWNNAPTMTKRKAFLWKSIWLHAKLRLKKNFFSMLSVRAVKSGKFNIFPIAICIKKGDFKDSFLNFFCLQYWIILSALLSLILFMSQYCPRYFWTLS